MNTVKMIRLAMRFFTQDIYTPCGETKVLDLAEFDRYQPKKALVSLADDGQSNPQLMTVYGCGFDCWYITEARR